LLVVEAVVTSMVLVVALVVIDAQFLENFQVRCLQPKHP
jgi:hypothetical protein